MTSCFFCSGTNVLYYDLLIYWSGTTKLYMTSWSIGVAQSMNDLLIYCSGKKQSYIWPLDLLEWHKQAIYDLLVYWSCTKQTIYDLLIYWSGTNKLYMTPWSIGAAQTNYIWPLDLLEWHKQALYDLLNLLEWHKQAIYDLLIYWSGTNKLYMTSWSTGAVQTSCIWPLDLLEWHKQAIYITIDSYCKSILNWNESALVTI